MSLGGGSPLSTVNAALAALYLSIGLQCVPIGVPWSWARASQTPATKGKAGNGRLRASPMHNHAQPGQGTWTARNSEVQRSFPCRPLCFPVAASPSLPRLLFLQHTLSCCQENQSVGASEPVACADSQLIIHSPTPTPTLLRLSRPLPLSWLRLASSTLC